AWKQLRLARERVAVPETMDMYVDAGEGHNDFLMCGALVMEALACFIASRESGYVVRPMGMVRGRHALIISTGDTTQAHDHGSSPATAASKPHADSVLSLDSAFQADKQAPCYLGHRPLCNSAK